MNRREALARLATFGIATLSQEARAIAEGHNWVDAHSHIWSNEAERFPPATRLSNKTLDPPRFTASDLLEHAVPEGVRRAVLVQPTYYLFDHTYLLDAVRRLPQHFRAVGILDELQPSPSAEMKRLLSLGVAGFRINNRIGTVTIEKWLNAPGMQEMWKTAAETRQAMCCLVIPGELPAIGAMCGRFADTPVVIDHFGRISRNGSIQKPELEKLCALARHKSVCVKLSAFYAIGSGRPPYIDLLPIIRQLIDAFGPDRLMWGSDCPFQVRRGQTYADSISLIRDQLDGISTGDRDKLLGKTAERLFFFA